MDRLKIVITGTGRCGTVYMARLLTSLGIPCGHEGYFDLGGMDVAKKRILGRTIGTSGVSGYEESGWLKEPAIADSSYLAAPFLEQLDCKKIHVVRNPIKVLNSFRNYVGTFAFSFEKTPSGQKSYRQFIGKYLPEIEQFDREVDRIAYYIIHWNKMIEESGAFRVQVENLTPEFFEFINREPTEDMYHNDKCNSWVDTPFKMNRNRKIIQPNDISLDIRQDFLEMTERYGYKITNTPIYL